MAKLQVGQMFLRSPTGEFLSGATPIYKDVPDEQINKKTGMTKQEEKSYNQFANRMAHLFKEYIDAGKL